MTLSRDEQLLIEEALSFFARERAAQTDSTLREQAIRQSERAQRLLRKVERGWIVIKPILEAV